MEGLELYDFPNERPSYRFSEQGRRLATKLRKITDQERWLVACTRLAKRAERMLRGKKVFAFHFPSRATLRSMTNTPPCRSW